jgi:hypothetical protein
MFIFCLWRIYSIFKGESALGKVSLRFSTRYGEVSIEGNSVEEFKNLLAGLGVSEANTESVLNTILNSIEHQDLSLRIPVSVTPSKPEVTGVIEYTDDGKPHIIVPPTSLTAREVIGLILYAKSPNPVSMSELTELVVNNWKSVEMPYISSNLNQMRAFVIKEGSRGSFSYKLSGSGRNWIENELLPKLKAKTKSDS